MNAITSLTHRQFIAPLGGFYGNSQYVFPAEIQYQLFNAYVHIIVSTAVEFVCALSVAVISMPKM